MRINRDTCIASNNDDQITLYDCACRECTRIAWENETDASYRNARTLTEFRRETFPETWGVVPTVSFVVVGEFTYTA